jgi:hypothetical protein
LRRPRDAANAQESAESSEFASADDSDTGLDGDDDFGDDSSWNLKSIAISGQAASVATDW